MKLASLVYIKLSFNLSFCSSSFNPSILRPKKSPIQCKKCLQSMSSIKAHTPFTHSTHTHIHGRKYRHWHTHTSTLTYTHTHAHTHSHPHTHTHTHTHTHAHTHSPHSHPHTHTLTHHHTHTHTHTHTHRGYVPGDERAFLTRTTRLFVVWGSEKSRTFDLEEVMVRSARPTSASWNKTMKSTHTVWFFKMSDRNNNEFFFNKW